GNNGEDPDEENNNNEESNEQDENGNEENHQGEGQEEPETTGEINAVVTNEEEPIEENEESQEDESGNEDENGNEQTTPTPEEPEEPEEPAPTIESKTLIKTNNYFTQKVLSSLVENPQDTLVEAAANMVNDYYQLSSLYELYFGFEMSGDLPEEISESLHAA